MGTLTVNSRLPHGQVIRCLPDLNVPVDTKDHTQVTGRSSGSGLSSKKIFDPKAVGLLPNVYGLSQGPKKFYKNLRATSKFSRPRPCDTKHSKF